MRSGYQSINNTSTHGCSPYKEDVPLQQQLPKNMPPRPAFLYRLSESNRSKIYLDRDNELQALCLGMIKAVRLFEGRRSPGDNRQQVQTHRELSQYSLQKMVTLL